MMLDLPHPLGPTTAHMLPGNWTVVGSTNDLKPASLMDFRRIIEFVYPLLALGSDYGPKKLKKHNM